MLRCTIGCLVRQCQSLNRFHTPAYGLRVVPERHVGVRMSGEFRHQSDFHALRLQARNEQMSGAVRRNWRQAELFESRVPNPGPKMRIVERTASTDTLLWPLATLPLPREHAMELTILSRASDSPVEKH